MRMFIEAISARLLAMPRVANLKNKEQWCLKG